MIKGLPSINLFILISLFLLSCATQDYLISQNLQSQAIEKEDHEFCVSLGLDFGENKLKNEVYWRCRLKVAESKIKDDIASWDSISQHVIYQDLINKTKRHFNENYEKWQNERASSFGAKDDKICKNIGYDIEKLNPVNVENYLLCRKKLIENWQLIPPYQNSEYFNRPQDIYNLSSAINQEIDRKIILFKSAQEQYPKCARYQLTSNDFKNCTNDYAKNKQCLSEIDRKKSKKQLMEQQICYKNVYLNFPEEMLKREKKMTYNTNREDLQNGNNFDSIGISESDLKKFQSKDPLEEEEKEKNKKEAIKLSEKRKNNKNNLYTKIELNSLRKNYLSACYENYKNKIEQYSLTLEKNCASIVEKWEQNRPQSN